MYLPRALGASLACVACLPLLAACGADQLPSAADAGVVDQGAPADMAPRPPDLSPDPQEPLFDPGRIVEVEITLAAADWDALRGQARSLGQLLTNCLSGPFPDPFTYFHAQVTVDGHRFDDVGVRKKGFLGSLDPVKPSLRIKFDQYVAGQKLAGLKAFTLNNSKQDPSYLHQCLAYQQFQRDGVPASRCNFAHVRVNGADLGLYVHVESGSKDFLERHYDKPGGNLYEGTLSDFRDGWIATFDAKTNEMTNDRSDLPVVVAALKAPDDQLLAQVGAVVDLDEYFTFWATETLVTHWDGSTGNNNNFFAYHNPKSGKFEFLPWGVDATYNRGQNPFQQGAPTSVQAASQLARRLYLLPAARDRYVATLKGLLADKWKEAELLADIDRMEKLITPVADPTGKAGLKAAIEGVRDFVRNRRAEIENELKNGPPAWNLSLPSAPCFMPIGTLSGSLQTTWGTVSAPDPFKSGTGTLAGSIYGQKLNAVAVGANAGLEQNPQPPNPPRAQLGLAALLDTGVAEVVIFEIVPPKYVPNASVALDFANVLGAVYRFVPLTNTFEPVGLFSDGTLKLGMAGNVQGAAVTATFSGNVIKSPF